MIVPMLVAIWVLLVGLIYITSRILEEVKKC